METQSNELYLYIALGIYGLALLVGDCEFLMNYSLLSKKTAQQSHRQFGLALIVISIYLLNSKYNIIKFK
jgi:hypothetical protein